MLWYIDDFVFEKRIIIYISSFQYYDTHCQGTALH